MIRRGRPLFRRLAAVAALVALFDWGWAGAHAAARPTADSAACQWPMYGQNPARTMSSACPAAPSPAEAPTLVPIWHVHTPDVVTAVPTVADGTVYVGDWSGHFFALDHATGRTRWSTVLGPARADGQADHHQGAYGTITSSAAVARVGSRSLVFVGAGASLYALDASPALSKDAARVVWRRDFDPAHPNSPGEVESSPVVWTGAPGGPEVLIGSDANQDSGYVGEGIWAVRAATGQVVWHFNPEAAAGKALYGCGNVWSSPALGLDPRNPDPQRRAVIYFGTADCPDNSPQACPKDGSDPRCPAGHNYDFSRRWQPYAESIMALSAVSAKPLWSYQGHPPRTADDDDYGPSAQLFSLPDGTPVVGEAGKDGYYAVLRRSDGHRLWARPETGNGNVQPGFALGGFIGTPAVGAVAGVAHVFGASAINTPFTYDSSGSPVPQSAPALADEATPMVAFDGSTGQRSWAAVQAYTYGSTSFANGVVYTGALDGFLRAYDAASGALLWAFPLGAPVSSGTAVAGNTVVAGTGTSESDVEFKTCEQLPDPLAGPCRQTPLNQTLNPLGDLGAVWAFRPAGT